MWLKYLAVSLLWFYLLRSVPTASGTQGECDMNVCEEDEQGLFCATGSVILITEVMCRTKGRNCDTVAYRELTRLCSGRQYCDRSNLWLVSGKYCEKNEKQLYLSIAFVSYVCVKVEAVESNCSKRGSRVTSSHRYISSPGYPALVTGNSMCVWKLHPPRGFGVDIFVREYLHLDDKGTQFLKIQELSANGVKLQLDMTSKKGLSSKLDKDVELHFFTDDSTKGHRMWIEYRYVLDSSLDHMRQFPAPNKTECGPSLLNNTDFPGRHSPTRSSSTIPTTTTTTTVSSLPPSPTSTISSKAPTNKDISNTATTTTLRAPPSVNGTDVHKDKTDNTAITVAIAVCAVGLACCVVAVWVTCRHRKKKATAHSRNCLATDTYSVEYDRASLTSTPSSHPFTRPSPLVSSPRHPNTLSMVDVIRQSEMVQIKSGLFSPPETIIEASPQEDNETTPMSGRTDRNGETLDLSKYLITDSENPTNTMSSSSSKHSSNGHIYDVVREH